MKINPEKILLQGWKVNRKKAAFLISGNEESLVYKIQSSIADSLKKLDFDEVNLYENDRIHPESNGLNGNSLFSNKQISIYKNPKDVDLDYIDSFDFQDTAIIINDTKIKSSSKIKRFFDAHKDFLSISCFKINKDFKKKYIEFIIIPSSIELDKNSFWFLLENTSDNFLIFESEIKKIINFNKKNPSLEEIKLIISQNKNNDSDRLFFLILHDNKKIINAVRSAIQSSSDVYALLQRTKFFNDHLLGSKNYSEASENFPRYLFANKNSFLLIFKKTTKQTLNQNLKLIKKTELFLRKNPELYTTISLKLLMGLKKNLSK